MTKITPITNFYTTKPIVSTYIAKPDFNPVFGADARKLKPAFDTFERSIKKVTVDDIKKLFKNNNIGGGIFRKEMYKVKTALFIKGLLSKDAYKKWKHSVDLSNPLKDFDYNEITDFMNMHNGKFIDLWKNEKDGMRNIEKLALFIRSLRHLENTETIKTPRIDKLKFFKSLPEEEWKSCIDGIINKPSNVIEALMQYKYSSTKINEAISYKNGSQITNKYIKMIEDFLDKQKLKTDMNVYRGEGDFNLFNSVIMANGKTLKEVLEEATTKIENGEWAQADIDKFIREQFIGKSITQERFMSTAIIPYDTEKYAKKIMWHIDVPKGTKASFIESYNVERASESEILI